MAKHLADLRLKHLKETEALLSGIRASTASQKLKDAAAVDFDGAEERVETGGRGEADSRGATLLVYIDFAAHPHVAETEARKTVERAYILSTLGASNAGERRAHARARTPTEENAKEAMALDILSMPATKRHSFRRRLKQGPSGRRVGAHRRDESYDECASTKHLYHRIWVECRCPPQRRQGHAARGHEAPRV